MEYIKNYRQIRQREGSKNPCRLLLDGRQSELQEEKVSTDFRDLREQVGLVQSQPVFKVKDLDKEKLVSEAASGQVRGQERTG